MKVAFPFPMPAAVDNTERFAQMALNMKRDLPWFRPTPQLRYSKPLNVVAFGPSLHDTWERVQSPSITCSGALDFMVRRGVEPQLHVEMDPREHKIAGLRAAPESTEYIVASVCHPRVFEKLQGRDVTLWHFYCGKESLEWVEKNDPAHNIFLAGSSVGLGAIMLGIQLGYLKFRIFGMDNSFKDGMRHAGPHLGAPHEVVEVEMPDGEVFHSSRVMVNSAAEVMQWCSSLPGCSFEFHGHGLQQALVKGANHPNMTVVP